MAYTLLGFEKLESTNYAYWKSCMKSYLIGQDLWEVVNGLDTTMPLEGEEAKKNWRIKSGKAMYILQCMVNKENHLHIQDVEEPKKAWHILTKNYSRSNETQFQLFENKTNALIQGMHLDLYNAARSGDVKLLKDMAVRDAQLLYSEAPEEQTALHIAARLGHAEFVKEMLELCGGGTLLLKLNSQMDTPLHCAARNGKHPVVEILICWASNELNGDVERGDAKLLRMRNKHGNTALHEAVPKCHDLVARKLLQTDPTLSVLVNNEGESALHLAAKAELPIVVEDILTNVAVEEEKRQLVRKQDNNGRTALHYAARRNNNKIVDMLLGSDLSVAYILDHDGYSPLHIAAACGSWEVVKSLLNRCPDALEQHDSSGRTSLHICIYSYSWFSGRFLGFPNNLKENLINEADKDGNTPLHLAAKRLSPRLTAWLLESKGVDLKIKNKDGFTPLDLAKSQTWKHPTQADDVMEVLKYHGAVEGNPWQIDKVPDEIVPLNVNNEVAKEATATYAIAVALIATVSFAAILTVPGGFNSNGKPTLAGRAAFKAFLISNTISMCCSIAAGVCLIRETNARWAGRTRNMDLWGFSFVSFAYQAMVVAFIMAVYMVVAPESIWLFIVVCLICCVPVFLDRWLLTCVRKNKSPRQLLRGRFRFMRVWISC